MEFVLLALGGFSLYVLDRYQDYRADCMAGEAFDELNEVQGEASYYGKTAKIVQKNHVGHVFMPLFPSIYHDFKVLCVTDGGHWFWFRVVIKFTRLTHSGIEPISEEEARKALKNDPEKYNTFFTASDDTGHSSHP